MLSFTLFAVAAVAGALCYGAFRARRGGAKLATALLSASLLASISLVPSAGALTTGHRGFKISNAIHSSLVGTPIHVRTTGGAGSGPVTFSVSGTDCSIKSSGLLDATQEANCYVKASKSFGGKSATSSAVHFEFFNRSQSPLVISNASHAGVVGTPLTVTTSGGSGNGANHFAVTGFDCSIVAATGVLSASGATTCTVTVTKAGSAGYNPIASKSVSFTFAAKSGTATDTPTFAHPDVATMTSVTNIVNAAPLDDTANGDLWFINQFYSPTDHWNFSYVTPGSSFTETWHVAGSNGQALANTVVTLETHFAGTDTHWTATGIDSNGYVSSTTDPSGNVSFALTNSDSAGGSAPADTTTAATALAAENTNPWTRMALVVGTPIANAGLPAGDGAVGSATDVITAGNGFLSTVNQATDLVDFIVIPAAGGGGGGGGACSTVTSPTFACPDKATISSVTGGVNSTPIDNTANGDTWFINQYYSPTDHWNYTYITAGSSVTETWKVVGSNGQPLANTVVTLETGFSGGSTATSWKVTGSTNAQPVGDLAGQTDSSGYVSFSLTNTNTTSGVAPADTSLAATANNAEANNTNPWGRMVLVVGTATSSNGSATDTITANPNTTVNQATDLVDFIVIP